MPMPRNHVSLAALVLVLGLLPGASGAGAADDPCAGFGWNVTHERALFAATAQAMQGAASCNGPHKIVQLTLPAGQELVLQVSGTASPHTRITVTPAPPTAH